MKYNQLCSLAQSELFLPNQVDQWYYENSNNSNTLVISAGDSWTWGVGLGGANLLNDNFKFRTSHVYGTILSSYLNSDFINAGFPGINNNYIIKKTFDVLSTLNKKYDKIFVVFTFTESGRDLKDNFLKNKSMYNDVLRGDSWPTFDEIVNQTYTKKSLKYALKEMSDNDIYFQYILNVFLRASKHKKIIEILEATEKTSFKMLTHKVNSFEHQNIVYIVGRNFINTFNTNIGILKNNAIRYLPSRWTDIISMQGNLPSYPDNIYEITMSGIAPLFEFDSAMNQTSNIIERTAILDKAKQGINWLEQSTIRCESICYPNPQGHQWWADYILENIHSYKI